MEGKQFFRILIILNPNKDADRHISFYHLSRRNRAKAVKSHNSDSDVRMKNLQGEMLKTYIENLQGEMLKNLGGKKESAKDMQSREIWGLSCILVVLDHISSSLLLFTNSIFQTYLDNSKKIQERKMQLSGAGTDRALYFPQSVLWTSVPTKQNPEWKQQGLCKWMYEVNNFFEPIHLGLALGNSMIEWQEIQSKRIY